MEKFDAVEEEKQKESLGFTVTIVRIFGFTIDIM